MTLPIGLSIISILIGVVCMAAVIVSVAKGFASQSSLVLFILNGLCGIVCGAMVIGAAYKNLITENNISSIIIALLIFIFFALVCIVAVLSNE